MPKKSKRQRRKEYQSNEIKVQKTKKVEVSLFKKGEDTEFETIRNELLKIERSELSEQEKLIKSLILLNPEKMEEGDVMVDEEINVLYYGSMLNIETFKNLLYPKGYKYQFSKYPKIIFDLNGVERCFILRNA